MEKKKSVVIADSSAAFCEEIAAAVNRSADLIVTGTAYDGKQAVELVRQQQPDVLVLDLLLPKLDGIGVLKELDSMERSPVIIATSAFITDYVVTAAHDLGAKYLMLKPIDADALVQRIEDFTAEQKCDAKKEATSLEVVVAELLFEIGIPADIKGYPYLKEAIMMAVEDMDVINAITKMLYPYVARRFQTTPERVEGAIRSAIDIAWDRGDLDTLQRFFGYTVSNTKGKPTNSEFIALLADKLQLQLKSGKIARQEEPCFADAHLVTAALHEIGVPAHIKGYQYLREAIILTVADGSIVYDMSEKVYTPVAKEFATKPERVRRAMLHAVEVAWDRGDLDTLQAYFGYTVSNTKGRPTTSEFIAMVSERIRLGLSPIN